jgi:hypothetical protein
LGNWLNLGGNGQFFACKIRKVTQMALSACQQVRL